MIEAMSPEVSESPRNGPRVDPRWATMRSGSQKSQRSISKPPRTKIHRRRRTAPATVVIMILILCAPPVFAGVETIADQGRRAQTGPKEAQIAVNGFPIDHPALTPTPSGYSLSEQGRLLRARPTQSVLVGLTGCPGCDWGLEFIGGLYLEFDRGIVGHNHRRGAGHRRPLTVDRRSRRSIKGFNHHD